MVIGERSEPPSDKLGGEICIAARACMYLSIIIAYGQMTVPCPRYMLHAQRGQLINTKWLESRQPALNIIAWRTGSRFGRDN